MPRPEPSPPDRRVLIVNADDLGYTVGVNRAVLRCARDGVVTSATLMANGAAFDDAVERVRECPGLGVGVHLVLTELRPVAAAGELADLLEDHGTLPATLGSLVSRLARSRAARDALRRELDRQVEKVRGHGIVPTHLDTHKHVHVAPPVLEAALDVARRHGIPWIRSPFEHRPRAALARLLAREDRILYLRQALAGAAISIVQARFRRRVRQAGLRTTDHFVGIALTGLWTEAAAEEMLRRVRPGLTEWMVHPGDCDEELRGQPTRLKRHREQERDLLLSRRIRDRIEAEGIVLSHYQEEL